MDDYDGSSKFTNDQIASKFWEGHLKRNQSIIVDLMQGQFKSTLKCPLCNRMKVTFDPYMSVQLPIPQTIKMLYFFIPYEVAAKIYQGEIIS